jgi:hypothetical protein
MQSRQVLRSYAIRVSVLLLLTLLYAALVLKYRSYDIDNPWFLSFSYNACHGGPLTDEFQQARYPIGMDGVHLFGKLAAHTECLVLDRTGWIPAGVVPLNLGFTLVALWLWWSFLLVLGYRERWIAAFILFLGVTEPVVAMVEKGRYEFLAFLLLALALWLGVKGLEFAAALVAMLAVESEPAAVLVPLVVVLLLVIRSKDWKRLILKLGVAALIALAVYMKLHPGAIQLMAHTHYDQQHSAFGGTMRSYFFKRKRHLLELAMLLLGVFFYLQRRPGIHPMPLWCAAITAAMLILLPHGNVAYELFAMPFLLWVALEGYDGAPRWRWVPALAFLLTLAQYGYLYHANRHEGFRAQDFAGVRERISASEIELGVPDSQTNICGDYSLWFAHPQDYHVCSTSRMDAMEAANLYLCFDAPLETGGLSAPTPTCSELEAVIPLREMSSLKVRGHLLHVLRQTPPAS